MFAFLDGILAFKSPVTVVINCGGVGYEVFVPLSTFENLPSEGERIKLHIHYSFNETDGVRLFGFHTLQEKELFRLLISVSKIGPKLGLAVLSGMAVDDFVQAVASNDVGLMSTVPGIGKKTAERLIIELKDKVPILSLGKITIDIPTEKKDIIQEAETGLITLGYKQYEVKKAIAKVAKAQSYNSAEELIKAAIKTLYKKRKR
ncbi:MAG: Holliday junction branch migration protein RuvA [Candidatus Cloacimonadota bacterium]|nr:Holliday junction branch migration protein RuvA [Candidatus Cloacimonadota bacterium]